MKNEILDTPFDHAHITLDEAILWEGKPTQSMSILDFGFNTDFFFAWIKRAIYFGWFLLAFFIFYNIFGLTDFSKTIWIIIGAVSVIGPEYFIFRRRLSTNYIITSKQIIFHLWWWGKKSTHVIPLKDVVDVTVAKTTFSRTGTLLLTVKNNHLLGFETYDFMTNERRHQPTLEMVRNVMEVAKLINETAQKTRSQLK